jgi:hypothetical protein
MMSAKHILMLILMVYVSVLNIMLVQSLFDNYLSKYARKTAFKNASRHGFPATSAEALAKQALKLEHLKHTQLNAAQHHVADKAGRNPACPDDDSTYIIGLVPSAPDLSIHNDMMTHRTMRIMSEVRHVLRHDRHAKAHIYVFLSANTFLAAHRTWCQIMPEQTAQRATCELVLLQQEASNALLFQHVLEKEKCLQDFILLHDSAHIGPSFLARIQGASRHKATCLAASAHIQRCPLPAFRLPRAFLVAWLWNKYDASMSIEAAAMEFHLWGGGVTAVGT